jgi:7-carboxy-7-deazaguanine synthase
MEETDPDKRTVKVHSISVGVTDNEWKAGRAAITLKLQGCPVICKGCHAKDLQDPAGGQEVTYKEIYDEIKEHPIKTLVITGGEPTMQPGLIELVRYFMSKKYTVILETYGLLIDLPLFTLVPWLSVDIKTPSTGLNTRKLNKTREIAKSFAFKTIFNITVADSNEVGAAIETIKDMQWRYHDTLQFTITPFQGSNTPTGRKNVKALLEKIKKGLVTSGVNAKVREK